MSGAQISITLNDEVLEGLLSRLQSHMKDLSEPLADIGSVLVSSTLSRFSEGRGPDGQPWLKSERAVREGGQTLVDTALLQSSITYQVENDGVRAGTNMIYGGIHQFGGQAGRGGASKIPARPYLGIDGDDRDEIRATVGDWLAEVMP